MIMVIIFLAISQCYYITMFSMSKVIMSDFSHCVMILRILQGRNLHCTLDLWWESLLIKDVVQSKTFRRPAAFLRCHGPLLKQCLIFLVSYTVSSRSTADLVTVVSDRIASAFNWSVATQAVAIDTSKVFDRALHAHFLHTLKSYRISSNIFGLISSFLSNRQVWMVLDGISSHVYLMLEFLKGPALSLLYSNDFPDDGISNFIYADDATLCSKCDQTETKIGF